MSFREALAAKIKDNRPNISDSSVKTYVSCLVSLAKGMNFDLIDDLDKNEEAILHFLSEKPARSRKTTLSALFVLTGKNDYRDAMLVDCKTVNDDYKNQKKSKSEEENWISFDDVKKIYDEYLAKASAMLNGKEILQTDVIVRFWLLVFLSGAAGNPPRRSMDICLLKTKDFDREKDNYYDAKKKEFVFNVYKTAKVYGQQKLVLPKELQKLVAKWIKINPTEYFVFSSNNKQLTSPQVSKYLNSIFGKKVSTDLLRHAFLSDLYKDVPDLKSIEATATAMGHSPAQAMLYVKKS